MPIFKGFNIEYPHYTVVCPQTGYTYDVRSLNVMETEKLKGSLTVPAKTSALLNEMLWKSLVAKPNGITSFDNFKQETTLRDREALVYALYISTFGEDRDFDVRCRSCSKEQTIKINLSKIFSMEAYPVSMAMKNSYKVAKAVDDEVYDPIVENSILKNQKPEGMPAHLSNLEFGDDDDDGITLGSKPGQPKVEIPKVEEKKEEKPEEENNPDSILTKRIDLELPISKVHAILKQPTLIDEEKVLNSIPFAQRKQTDLMSETLIIDRFEQYELGAKVPSIIVADRNDVLYGYQTLPPLDKIEIYKKFRDTFGKYGIELKTGYVCSSCGESQELEVDIVVQFFRILATM